MKRYCLWMALLAPVLVSGCATTSSAARASEAPSVENAVVQTVTTFLAALGHGDVAAAMGCVAGDFSHYAWGDKAGAQQFLESCILRGDLEDFKTNTTGMIVTARGEVAEVRDILLAGKFGMAHLDLVLAQRDGAWRILGADVRDMPQ